MKLKVIYFFIFIFIFSFTFAKASFGIYDSLSRKNNVFGIHILFPEEISEASVLVNSNGGDWGYVTIPIKASDRNLIKWQTFMNEARKYDLIPIVRLATDGDYFSKDSWSKPSSYDILDFANFLNSLVWPTQNRYVVVYNEPNRGDEWGGTPNASEYAQILDYATKVFKERNPDFFVISAGLDNASANVTDSSINEYDFMYEMNSAVPGIFSKIDGLGSHSYPNPGFSAPPSNARMGINSFYYEENFAYELSGKKLPVFITETGWSSDKVAEDQQSQYYIKAFSGFWENDNIVAVTPFIFNADDGPFTQFSFIKDNKKTQVYYNYINFPKTAGDPLLTNDFYVKTKALNPALPVKKFKDNQPINSIFETINRSSKTFFKWLLNV